MSLDFKVDKIADWTTTCYDDYTPGEGGYLKPVTKSIIWATMAVDIGDLSAKLAPEFYARLQTWERLHGTFLIARNEEGERSPEPLYITPEQVMAHVGLRTNVTTLNRTMWQKKLVGRHGVMNTWYQAYEAAVGKLADQERADAEAAFKLEVS